MAKAQNQVIAGDYQGKIVCLNRAGLYIALNITGSQMVMLDKSQVESYELITSETSKSASSGIMRSMVGAAFLGSVGLLAGVSAKNVGINTVAIRFKDGKKSLLEIDEEKYRQLIQNFL